MVVNHQRISHLFLIFALTKNTASFASNCKNIPEQSDAPLAIYCEDQDSYSFDLAGDQISFSKHEFQTRLSRAIKLWWAAHGLSQASLTYSDINVWLSIPEANPQAAQARAVVMSPIGHVSLSFDLHDEEWRLSDQEAGVLDRYNYPDSYGWRPQQLMISFNPGTSREQATTLLQKAGIKLAEETSPGWYKAETKIFDESAAIHRLTQYDRMSGYVRSSQLNKLFEWIAIRGRTVHFNMNSID